MDENENQVFVGIYRVGQLKLWFWLVTHRNPKFMLFDRMGLTRTDKRAFINTRKAVLASIAFAKEERAIQAER